MKVYKRGDGRCIVKYKDAAGSWKQRSFPTEEKALAFIREMEPAAEENRLTVEEAVALYCRNHRLAKTTKALYASLVCGYTHLGKRKVGCAEHLAKRFVDSLNRRDLESFRDAGRALGLATGTINRYASMLKAAFRYAADQDLLESVPWAKYKPLESGPSGSHKADREEDVWRVIKALPSWAQWACDTCISLCLRPGRVELFGLKWDAFNWKSGCVTVHMGKVGRSKLVYPSPAYLDRAKERQAASTCEWVVEGSKGGRGNADSFKSAWRNARKKVGVTFPSYAMRHLAASTMLAQGASIAVVAEMLGHKNPATTASFYVHSSVREQKAAAALLPDLRKIGADGADSES